MQWLQDLFAKIVSLFTSTIVADAPSETPPATVTRNYQDQDRQVPNGNGGVIRFNSPEPVAAALPLPPAVPYVPRKDQKPPSVASLAAPPIRTRETAPVAPIAPLPAAMTNTPVMPQPTPSDAVNPMMNAAYKGSYGFDRANAMVESDDAIVRAAGRIDRQVREQSRLPSGVTPHRRPSDMLKGPETQAVINAAYRESQRPLEPSPRGKLINEIAERHGVHPIEITRAMRRAEAANAAAERERANSPGMQQILDAEIRANNLVPNLPPAPAPNTGLLRGR